MKVIVAVLLLLVSTALATFLYQEPKISDKLKKEIFSLRGGKQTLEVIAYLQPMDINAYKAIENIETRAQFLVNDMIQYAKLSQESIIAKLKQAKVEYTSFWISNAISIPDCPIEILNYLATHPLVTKVLSDKAFKAGLPEPEQHFAAPANASVEWNIEWITATKVWDEFGKEGQGMVVAVADTGIHYEHPALVDHYRGKQDDGSFNHNYNWWDGIRKPVGSGMGKCKVNATEPCDDQGHGTHCMGTILGATDSHTWGVAPKAKFIGCRNMDRGLGRPSTYISCMQFLIAPTDLKGENPKPELRPHVVSNSWGCPRSELCEPNSLKEAVEATTAAGIMMAIAAGNDGSSCSSANAPPGIYEAAYTVGALGFKSDTITGFSSRGPVRVDGSNRRKPDICAPGSSIVSSYPPNRYTALSGTSMATPHVAGSVILFWSAVPAYARNLEKTMDIINKNAKPMSSSACGSSGVPNNTYGFGNIQIYNAVKAALKELRN